MLDQAAWNLYFWLHHTGQLSHDEILKNVTEWAFQVLPPAEKPNVEEESELSLVETEARNSFLTICEDATNTSDDSEERESPQDGTENGEEESGGEERQVRKENNREEVNSETMKRRLTVVPAVVLKIRPWTREETVN